MKRLKGTEMLSPTADKLLGDVWVIRNFIKELMDDKKLSRSNGKILLDGFNEFADASLFRMDKEMIDNLGNVWLSGKMIEKNKEIV
tara:strand:- start:484 stop:741 length:258 start_codon:yes stop_codon:yes gene_type:complete